MTLPDRTSTPTGAVALHSIDHFTSSIGTAKRHQDLVEHDVVEHAMACGTEPVCEPACVLARALDQIGKARPTQLAQRSPHLDSARATREVGRILIRHALLVLGEIRAVSGHRAA